MDYYFFLLSSPSYGSYEVLAPSKEQVTFQNGNKSSDSSFVDDVKIFLKGTVKNLTNAKIILDDFKKLCGLEINAEKTQILSINCPENLERDTAHLGF